ncbi:MAG: FG-GAP-like repeat-containing protein [bacterium]
MTTSASVVKVWLAHLCRTFLIFFLFLFLCVQSVSGQFIPGDENWDDRFGPNGLGLNGPVRAMAVKGNELYVGGDFTLAGTVQANYFAIWDGSNWSALGSGLNNGVWAIAIYQNKIYVGGAFTMAGGKAANRVAVWDGISWWPLGDGVDDRVYAITVDDFGNVFAAGEFTSAGGIIVNKIAKWDGENWSTLANGFESSEATLDAAAFFMGQIYVGGVDWLDDIKYPLFSNWNGQSWAPYWGSDGFISLLKVVDNNLYVGGFYEWLRGYDQQGNTKDTFAHNINKWNGNGWKYLGYSIFDDNYYELEINALVDYQDFLYYGGRFGSVIIQGNQRIVNHIARWDGKIWAKLGNGVKHRPDRYGVSVNALERIGNNIFVGGHFTIAGHKLANNFSIWHEPDIPTVDGFCEDFEDGTVDGWTPLHAASWAVTNDLGTMAYYLHDDNNPTNPDLLGEYAIFENYESTDFTFECRARTAEDLSVSNRPDIALVYEYRDDQNYTFVAYNRDFNSTNISKVVNGVRTKLATSDNSVPVIQDDNYHALKVTRSGGQVAVYYDGVLVMSAIDLNPYQGKFGIGSKNDRAFFDNVSLNNACYFLYLPPNTPRNLIAIGGNGWVRLKWDANLEVDFLQYNIYGGLTPNPNNVIDTIFDATNNSTTITGLRNDVLYYFRITAVDSLDHESFFSNEVSVVPYAIFNRATIGEITNDEEKSVASSWVDYDNDGDLDLFVVNWATTNSLYSNNGDGTFTKLLNNDIVNTEFEQSRGGRFGDFDNDSDLDLFAAGHVNFLFVNNGNGTFSNIAQGEYVTKWYYAQSGGWVDYDFDGYLDIFFVGIDSIYLFTNNGNGTFTQNADAGFVIDDKDAELNNGIWGDLDDDHDLDLLVTAGYGRNYLFLNNSDGTFQRVQEDIFRTRMPMVVSSMEDYDNDGDLDIFLGDLTTNDHYIFKNNGDATFTRNTFDQDDTYVDIGLGYYSAGDFDNDGDLDLILPHNKYKRTQNNLLYLNNGDGTFNRISNREIVTDGGSTVGSSCGDFDNDGDLDLYLVNFGQPNFLYLNNANENSWINIKCVGTISNRSAIGTKVRCGAVVSGRFIWQMRVITGHTGNSLNVEFGLGDATKIDSIKIAWPSGIMQYLTDVSVNQFLTINEPDGPVAVELSSFSATGHNQSVQLRWETATETNNYGFEVQRRAGESMVILGEKTGRSRKQSEKWQKIVFLKGHGTSTQSHVYQYNDRLPELSQATAHTLKYRLKQIDLDGAFEYHGPVEVTIGTLPDKIILGQNYPNPFNPQTTIEFALPRSAFTTLTIYNTLGQEVKTLVAEKLAAGVVYKITFDGSAFPSGLYYFTVRSGEFQESKKMLVIK